MRRLRMPVRERWNDGGILDSMVRLENFVFTRYAGKPIVRTADFKNELVLKPLSSKCGVNRQ